MRGPREEPAPHLQRGTAALAPGVAADADLEQRELAPPQVLEVPLVVRGVAVHAPLVGAELLGELGEAHRPQPPAPLAAPLLGRSAPPGVRRARLRARPAGGDAPRRRPGAGRGRPRRHPNDRRRSRPTQPAQQQRERDRRHDHGDSTSSTRQAAGRAKSGASRRAPYARPKNHSEAAHDGPQREGPAPVVAVLVGEGPEQQHGVEVDVRVEEGQRRRGGQHRPQADPAPRRWRRAARRGARRARSASTA